MFGIVFLVALASIASAGISLVSLTDANNQNSQTIAITQGDLFDVETVAITVNSEQFYSEKLELVGNQVIFSISNSGTYLGYGMYSYNDTHTVDSTSFAPGTYTLRFSVVGTNANTGYDDLTLIVNPSNTAPAVSITNPTGGVEVVPPALTYTATDNENNLQDCQFSLDGGNSWSGWSACTGSFGVQTPLIIGSNTWIVQARDTGALVGSDSVTFTYTPTGDVNAPSVTITSPVTQIYGSQVTDISYIPIDNEGNLDQCWYSTDGGITNSTAVSCTDSQTNQFVGLSSVQGVNNWTVFASDLAGNVGSDLVTFTVNDTTAPTITAISPTNDEVLDDTDVTFSISTDEDATAVYSLDNAPNVTMTGTLVQYDSVLLTLNDDQSYLVTYYATDWAGNVGSLTINFSINENPSSGPSSTYGGDSYYNTEWLSQDNSSLTGSVIDLSNDNCSLNLWQRLINWFCKIFGLDLIYNNCA